MRRFNRLYGATLVHALGMAVCFAFAGYVASRVLEVSHPGWIAIWFIGAVVGHDLILFPLYAALDHVVMDRFVLARRRLGELSRPAVSWQNHLRAPAVLSGVLLLVSFPLVFDLSDRDYAAATGLHTSVYLGRWLVLSGCFFVASALVYGIRLVLHLRRALLVGSTNPEDDR